MLVEQITGLKFSTQVNTHNFTILLGWLLHFLPFGDLAYRANLTSVLTGSLCICVFYLSLNLIHRSWVTALIASLFLMLSHAMWWTTSCKQEHASDAFFISVAIYLYCCLQRYNKIFYLYILFFVAGLGFFNHFALGCILGGASIALLWRLISKRERIWPILWRCALCFIIGLIPYFLILIHDVNQSHSISQTLAGASGGQFRQLFFKGGLWYGITNYLYLICFQFPSLYIIAIILGPYFFIKSWKINENTIGVIFTFIPVATFFIFLNIWDKFLMMIPSFVILCFWSSFVIDKIVRHPRVTSSRALKVLLTALAALCLGWNIYFYSHLSQWGENPKSIWFSQYNNGYYDNLYRSNEFLANPNKRNNHDIENLCHLILEKLPFNAEYWDDDSRLYYQLATYYQGQYHQRPDLNIEMINSWGFSSWGADKSSFVQRLDYAYKNDLDFFLATLQHPYNTFLQALPNKNDYIFQEFRLNDKWWIYKLVTQQERYSLEKTIWDRWDVLPSDKPFLMDLKLNNVLNFNEGDVLLQENMDSWGPYWKNNDQIFFSPSKQNAEIGFLLRFNTAFTGNLTLNITTSYDSGIIEILLNNKRISPEPVDLYTPNVYFKKLEIDHVSFESGNNILSIQVIGKNERSAAMKLGVDTLQITPNLTDK